MNEGLCFDSHQEKCFFLFENVQTISVAHQASYLMGTRGCFQGVECVGYEGDPSSPSSVELNNGRS